MHSPHASFDPALAPEWWPVFGHASPQRYTRTHDVPGEESPAGSVDQEYEEYFFE